MADSLRRLVGEPRTFLAEHWTRRPWLRRGDSADDFADLFDLDDADHLVTRTALRAPAFRLVQDGKPLPASSYLRTARIGSRPVDDLIDPGRVLDRFAEGATIVLQGLQRFWPPLTRFCRDLELELTQPVQANAYLTPRGSEGLGVHHDVHDVFAVQAHGRKHWACYEPHIRDPLSGQLYPKGRDPGPAVLETDLESGDVLYVPRGTPHAVRSVDEPSLHITIGVTGFTWHDVVRQVADRARTQAAFRAALPAGFARDPGFAEAVARKLEELADWVRELDAGALSAELTDRFWRGRRPLLDGQVRQLLELDDLDDDTLVERRPGAVARLVAGRAGEERVRLVLGDRELLLPARTVGALEVVVGRDRLKVAELAEHLDQQGRLVLVRRLVREGLLRVVRG